MRRVLIVDDNRSLAEDLAEILADEGYEACVFDDPASVVAAVDALQFDVALLDVRMPGMDGVSLHSELAKHHPSARFVLMSAYSEDDRIATALAAGVREVLTKPVPLDVLVDALSAAPGMDVLLVEDDAALADSLSELLSQHGYRCHIAATLWQAREYLARHRPDIALVDIRLPDGDGTDLAIGLASEARVDVLLTTGIDSVAVRGHGSLQSRGQRILVKPFSPDELLKAMADLRGRDP